MPSYHTLESTSRVPSPPRPMGPMGYDYLPSPSEYTSHLPPKKRTRSKLYPSEEARMAAKMVQKAKRREQNRNAQRRLRDRKEEHIFTLEGEVSGLRRELEEERAAREGLEEMVRRLVGERDELRRRVGEGEREEGYERERKESSVSTASSTSVATPSPEEGRGRGSMPLTPRSGTFPPLGTMGAGMGLGMKSPTQVMLPRMKLVDSTQEGSMMQSTLLPPVSAFQWNLH
uniref:BZIP domain-containing protein n=2 Tax=Kalmanozyma brasiliensis (strain GHG001) TaxID=1365824 RepID=V5GQI9_KALBG